MEIHSDKDREKKNNKGKSIRQRGSDKRKNGWRQVEKTIENMRKEKQTHEHTHTKRERDE